MAKIFSVPTEFQNTVPRWRLDEDCSWDDMDNRKKEWIEKLKAWVHENIRGATKNKYAGRVIADAVADGEAQYMIVSIKPLQLMHLPLDDAYQSRWAHRWTVSDVKNMVDAEDRFELATKNLK